MPSNILQFQKDIADYLGAHPSFTHVPIIRQYADENAGDALLDDQVNKVLTGVIPKNGKCGLAVVISSGQAKVIAQTTPGPVEDFSFMLQVIEHKGNNKAASTGTGIRCDELGETIKRLLHLWCHDDAHEVIVTASEEDDSIASKERRGWIIAVESKAHALEPLIKVARPNIATGGGLLALSCATAGAEIYFTTNGSFPAATNTAAAILYSGPVDISALPAGTLIRAAAYKAADTAKRGSDCAQAEI